MRPWRWWRCARCSAKIQGLLCASSMTMPEKQMPLAVANVICLSDKSMSYWRHFVLFHPWVNHEPFWCPRVPSGRPGLAEPKCRRRGVNQRLHGLQQPGSRHLLAPKHSSIQSTVGGAANHISSRTNFLGLGILNLIGQLFLHFVRISRAALISELCPDASTWGTQLPTSHVTWNPTALRSQLAKFHKVGELNGRYLSKFVAEKMQRFCDP